ncbi:CALML5 [Symbiodinium sp. CCMP2592]|nr:CALML5 [Symbiodinium sp. CCMP2592]
MIWPTALLCLVAIFRLVDGCKSIAVVPGLPRGKMSLGEPQTQGEEVKLIFDLLDVDHSGKIDADEMKRVLLSLSFSPDSVQTLIDQFDKNKDGELSIIEFWSWVNGHDGRQTGDFRPQLLDMAVAENKRKIHETEELCNGKMPKRPKQPKRHRILSDHVTCHNVFAKARRQEVRSVSLMFPCEEDFVRQKMEAGFSRAVAEELYSKCDQDRDGEVNYQDIGWLVSDNLATVDQVRQTYQKGVQKKEEDISWSDDWKSEVSKLLKRRGFKEEEEGLKYHATNAAGESIALREILKDKTASLDSKHFPITLHLQASNVTVVDCDDRGLDQLVLSSESDRDFHPVCCPAKVDTFLAWDKDGNGTVSTEEMGQVLKQVNPKFTEVTLKRIFAEIDVNNDGVIDLQEFVSWLSGENLKTGKKKKKMKKKAKAEQDAKIAQTLQRNWPEKHFQALSPFVVPCAQERVQNTCANDSVSSGDDLAVLAPLPSQLLWVRGGAALHLPLGLDCGYGELDALHEDMLAIGKSLGLPMHMVQEVQAKPAKDEDIVELPSSEVEELHTMLVEICKSLGLEDLVMAEQAANETAGRHDPTDDRGEMPETCTQLPKKAIFLNRCAEADWWAWDRFP